jgi:glucosamine-6-phosphate deaminase
VTRERIHIPDGMTPNVPAFCRKYEDDIRAAGGIDLQVLGIGSDGHIGFNEPSSSLASRTRIKTLTAQTRRDNAPFFATPEDVPFHVITMGVGTIMDAREVVLLAFGERKAKAVAEAVEGPITAMNPASILQMHPVAKCIIDEPAAARLTRLDYYRWVYQHKPGWQKV